MLAAGCASTETLLVETTPVESSRYSALVIDGRDGRMLYGTNATAPRFPASLTKMMTLYMVFEALDQGRDIVERQVAQMVRLINDLLDVSRITRGKLTLNMESVSIGEVVATAVETIRPRGLRP